MNKLFLMKNPDLFQGEKYLTKNTNYFEGWYFKNTNRENGISFIPGISIDNENKKAFIQVITNNSSYFVDYNIKDFKCDFSPFCIHIGNNSFSKEAIQIDIKDEMQNLNVHGKIRYSNSKNINTSSLYPNIMGPFSYIPFMECNHAILSMKSDAYGAITINDTNLNFEEGLGYIEKDWGCSFPQSYIWCEGNNFQKSNASFMLSIADIPFKLFHFRGIICVLIINNQEFKFTTYNHTNLIKYELNNNSLNVILKKRDYSLTVESSANIVNKLSSPVKGKMEKDIFESISAFINVTLKKENTVIFSDKSLNCGLEIVPK